MHENKFFNMLLFFSKKSTALQQFYFRRISKERIVSFKYLIRYVPCFTRKDRTKTNVGYSEGHISGIWHLFVF
jgi:hypothetical protein